MKSVFASEKYQVEPKIPRFCTLQFKLCLLKLDLPLVFLIFLQKVEAPVDPDKVTQIKYAIELEIMRLNWTKKRARKCFKQKYNNRYFDSLNDEELGEFWQYLKTLKSDNYPTSPRQDTVCLLDDYERAGFAIAGC
ncbi:MAG: hypothetical protein ACFBSE_19620 [Prochloraceae cyanobacterium]